MATGTKTGGRSKGTPNHTTKEIREAYQLLIENNLDNMNIWIKKLANNNPEKAINIILKLSDFVLPKINKTEISEIPVDEFDNMTEEELEAELEKLNSKRVSK